MTEFFEKLEEIRIGELTLTSIITAALIFIVCFLVIKLVKRVMKRASKLTKLEKGVKSFLSSVIVAALWAVAAIIIADTLGIPTTSLVALLSVAGLALSLSIQGIMSNLFSGVTILTTKPFSTDNFIQLGDISGKVESIGLFYTQLLMPDNRRIFVPNSDVTASKIINFSDNPIRRVDFEFEASYECDTSSVKSALTLAALLCPKTLKEPPIEVHLSGYRDSNIVYILRVWVRTEDYWPVYYAINEKVRETFSVTGVYVDYPHVQLTVPAPPDKVTNVDELTLYIRKNFDDHNEFCAFMEKYFPGIKIQTIENTDETESGGEAEQEND